MEEVILGKVSAEIVDMFNETTINKRALSEMMKDLQKRRAEILRVEKHLWDKVSEEVPDIKIYQDCYLGMIVDSNTGEVKITSPDTQLTRELKRMGIGNLLKLNEAKKLLESEE